MASALMLIGSIQNLDIKKMAHETLCGNQIHLEEYTLNAICTNIYLFPLVA